MKHSILYLIVLNMVILLSNCSDDKMSSDHDSKNKKAAPVRSVQYIDDSNSNYLSDWKAMLTNAKPDKLLANGRWFSPSPDPQPFGVGEVHVFSDDIKAKLRENSTDALVVVQNDKIVGEYFRYGFSMDDIHLIHSTGKAFTSFAIQPVYDSIGTEGLNKKLRDYLPKLENSTHGDATLSQVLDMSAAVEWSENYEDPTSATMLSAPIGGWEPIPDGEEPKSWYTMMNFPKIGEHGKVWSYNSVSVIVSSFAAEAISGKHYSELVQDSYDKLGFEDRSFYVQNTLNELSAEGGQALTIRDFLKLGRYMLHTKDSKYVEDVWRMDGENTDILPDKYKEFAKNGYKCYWYRFNDDVILAIGSSGQFLYIDRSKDLIIGKYSSYIQGQSHHEGGKSIELLTEISSLYRQ